MQVSAARFTLGNLFNPSKLVAPDSIALEGGRVIVTRRRLFGLLKSQDDVGLSQVASVELHSGIFNSTVVVQAPARGDLDLSVSGLPKKQAQELVSQIRRGAS